MSMPIGFTILIPFLAPAEVVRRRDEATTLSVGREIVSVLERCATQVTVQEHVSNLKLTATIAENWARDPLSRSLRRKYFHRAALPVMPITAEIAADFDLEAFRGVHTGDWNELDDAQIATILTDVMVEAVSKTIADVLFAACVARPCTFQTDNAHWLEDGKLKQVHNLSFRLGSGVRLVASEYKWPPIVDLPVSRSYAWIQRVPRFCDGVSEGPVGRALAAISYIVSPSHQNQAEILWPLIGLEALYGRGKEGLERQILEKSELFLGPRSDFKSKFRNIYQIRSRFIHGDVDFPYAYSTFETDAGRKFTDNSGEVSELATAILIASIQKLALEGRTDLEFRYVRTDVTLPTASMARNS